MFRRKLFNEFDNLFNSLLNQDPFIFKGKTQKENGKDENGDWSKETFTSEDGMIQFTTIFRSTYGNTPQPEEQNTLERLRKELQNAVNLQEFEKRWRFVTRLKTWKTIKLNLKTLTYN